MAETDLNKVLDMNEANMSTFSDILKPEDVEYLHDRISKVML